ncbi:helix-turn-helix domain-containing protein [Nostoc sp.]|uniref:helix-turn-helix domain-containing protein n=1 Tax=Nostoc sp. TaxID=1180 RepID=UPI002FF755D1
MVKKYIVDLSEDEVSQLQTLIKKGKHKARKITHANILLMASEGETDQAIAAIVRVHVTTVERTREKFVIGGLDFALLDEPHPPKLHKLEGKEEAFLIATACSNPPSGRVRWTMQLLADHLIEVGIVDSISDETVRQTLKKTILSRGSKNSGAFPK